MAPEQVATHVAAKAAGPLNWMSGVAAVDTTVQIWLSKVEHTYIPSNEVK